MHAILFYFSGVGLLLTLSLCGPIFIGLLANEIEIVQRFAVYLLLGCFLFGGMVLATMHKQHKMRQAGWLILLLMVWILLPLLVALPFYDVVGLGYVDALFETVSGLTTSGSSVLNTVDIWPQPLIFWRVQLQWIGGFLALLTIVLVIAPMGIGGVSKNNSSLVSSFGFHDSQRLLQVAGSMGLFYILVTFICFLLLFLSGTRAFYAATLAMTATSTGGFLPFDENLDQILGNFGIFIFGMSLLIGATSIFWQQMLLKGEWGNVRRHRESYSIIAIVLLLAVLFTFVVVSVSSGGEASPLHILVEAFMNAASLVATSGVQSRHGYITVMPLVVVLFIVLVGGSAFSTSGGLKHYRIGGMMVQSWSELDRLIYPNIVRVSHFGSQKFDIGLMKAIWSFFVAAILVICVGTILIAASGIPFEASMTATISSFATAGPIYDAGWINKEGGNWPLYSTFSPLAKTTLMVVMVLGRLEVLAVIGLLSTRYWRTR